jgi:hypothetical protein
MDIEVMKQVLDKASLFDIWRTVCLANQYLLDEKRNHYVKSRLKVGMEIIYFEEDEGYVSASIVEIRRSKVLVKNKEDNKLWLINLFAINIDGVEVNTCNFTDKGRNLGKFKFHIGQYVGWMSRREHCELFGSIVKLNPKRARVKVGSITWTVPYNMLFPVLSCSAEPVKSSSGLVIEGEVKTLS